MPLHAPESDLEPAHVHMASTAVIDVDRRKSFAGNGTGIGSRNSGDYTSSYGLQSRPLSQSQSQGQTGYQTQLDPHSFSNEPGAISTSPRTSSSGKIRFAPLPDPRRQRSLSTGRNITTRASLSSDGTRIAERETKMHDEPVWVGDTSAVGGGRGRGRYTDQYGDDEDIEEEGNEDNDEESGWRKSTNWTMGMGSYTKKLLRPSKLTSTSTSHSSDQSSPSNSLSALGGAPLKKSVSTGGLIGNSPHRSSHEYDRRRSLLPTSSYSFNKPRQPRRESFEAPDFSSLSSSLGRQTEHLAQDSSSTSTSPPSRQPVVRMLNGRVYGANRQGSQPFMKERNDEPEFDEWGGMMGDRAVGGLGSNQKPKRRALSHSLSDNAGIGGDTGDIVGGGEFMDDEDDGSGMAWIRKRREQRRRDSEMAASRPVVVEDQHPAQSTHTLNRLDEDPTSHTRLTPNAPVLENDLEHRIIEAINVPSRSLAGGQHHLHDQHDTLSPPSSASSSEDDEQEDDNDDEDEDDGDFEPDNEEDLLAEEEAARTTSSAAAVEVISRHKD